MKYSCQYAIQEIGNFVSQPSNINILPLGCSLYATFSSCIVDSYIWHYLWSPLVVSQVRFAQSLVSRFLLFAYQIVVCSFVFFPLAIVLNVIFDLRILVTSLASSKYCSRKYMAIIFFRWLTCFWSKRNFENSNDLKVVQSKPIKGLKQDIQYDAYDKG